MKTAEELANYTYLNQIHMRKWYKGEYKYAEGILEKWAKKHRIKNRKNGELLRGTAELYDLGGNSIVQHYMIALLACKEEYTLETATGSIDIVFQEIARKLTDYMRTLYPCLAHSHCVIMRANEMAECVMYIGPSGTHSDTVCDLFDDDGVFMTEGIAECVPLFNNIELFD